MNAPLPSGSWHVHTHPAMNTLFTLRLKSPDAAKAAVLAGQCFRQLEDLEALLSRYREDSDISAINRLHAGESLLIHEETWTCLRQALDIQAMTGGLFDVTLGSLVVGECASNSEYKPELRGCLSLNPDRPEIVCVEPGRCLDLGAVGKGFAIDRMADTLRDLGHSEALLSAGASTHLAIGRSIWPVELVADAKTSPPVALQGNSLSASGTGIQGNHIIHPVRGPGNFLFPRRVWVVAATATFSDALSTACFLANDEERAGFLRNIPELSGIMVESPEGNTTVVTGSCIVAHD